MFDGDEIKSVREVNLKTLNSIEIFSIVFFVFIFAAAGYSALFLQFFGKEPAFVFYFISLSAIAGDLLLLIIFTYKPLPQAKQLLSATITLIVLAVLHVAALFWLCKTLGGCDGMFLIMAVPIGVLVGIMGVVFFAELIFLKMRI